MLRMLGNDRGCCFEFTVWFLVGENRRKRGLGDREGMAEKG